MNNKLNIISVFLVVLLLAAAGWALLTYEENYLWKAQELNLFLDTPLFFKQQMVVPGGMLTYLGTFFTEFFYHSWQGVCILCLWWASLVALTAWVFRIPLKWLSVALVPVALLLLSDVELGYWIYYLKLRGYFFVATIGTTVAVTAVGVYRILPSVVRPVYVALSALVLYPLAGAYGLLGVLMMAVMSWRLSAKSVACRITDTAVAVVALCAVPFVCYWTVYHQTSISQLYLAALPVFTIDKDYLSYYIPFILLGVFYVVMAIVYSPSRKAQAPRMLVWAAAQVVVVGLLVAGVSSFWYKDYNFHKELAMERAMEKYDWNGVLREASSLEDEPTRVIVMMKNLALFRQGRIGDEMFHYRNGAKECAAPIQVRMTQVVGRAIYYHYGQLNYCYRWCLEDGVEYGWRAEYLKYMTRCALVNGEYNVAAKYIGILKHTRYHREWAEAQETYLNHPEKLKANADYEPVFHLLNYEDRLGSDNSLVEFFLMNLLVNTQSDDPLMHELSLVAALWTKDIATFWPRFNTYAQSHAGRPMPVHFQEAAYLYGHLEHGVDISGMPFSNTVVETYRQFMEMAQKCAGMSEAQMKPIFYPQFHHTFYYEYFLVRNQKTF